MALAIDPANPATLYAGTAEELGFGAGLFKSVNGGASWTVLNSGIMNKNVHALVIDPSNPATLYAGTDSGVFKSTNGGATMRAVNSGLPRVYVTALAIDPSNPATLYTFIPFAEAAPQALGRRPSPATKSSKSWR
jgi:ligand-binding sensor domain-containing protein